MAHDDADGPEGREVDVPVPGVAGLRLEAAQEGVVHNCCSCILHQGADVQQVPPACIMNYTKPLMLPYPYAASLAVAGTVLEPETLPPHVLLWNTRAYVHVVEGRGAHSREVDCCLSLSSSDLTI